MLLFTMENGRSKREQKHFKMQRKELQDLQQDLQSWQRRLGEPNSPSECDPQPPGQRNGRKWWQRFDQWYYQPTSSHLLCQTREQLTSSRLLQQSPRFDLAASFAQLNILEGQEALSDPSFLHVMLKGHQKHALLSFQAQGESEEAALGLAGLCLQEGVCRRALEVARVEKQYRQEEQIERELRLWEGQLRAVSDQNTRAWHSLTQAVKTQPQPPLFDRHDSEIKGIREHLMWVTVLKYFEKGFADKTMQMLKALLEAQKLLRPVKGKDGGANKKFFETDCKICFCSLNNDSNQVLYCDSCNTSFHLSCYGLSQVPAQEIYYCDMCQFQRQNQTRKPMCQICCKTNFPIKHLGGHFYHVTCLILLNLVQVHQGKMSLRKGVTHGSIASRVVESQLKQKGCQFCGTALSAQTGYRMRCSHEECKRTAHPICAYINGCRFKIRRHKKGGDIRVSFECNEHDEGRDWMEQAYLRRYMCNLKETSKMSLPSFIASLKEEFKKRQEQKTALKRIDHTRIIPKTRVVRKIMERQKVDGSSRHQRTEIGRMKDRSVKRHN